MPNVNKERLAQNRAAYDSMVREFEARTAVVHDDLAVHRDEFCQGVAAGSVIDLGCGPGRDSLYFKSVGFRVLGLDASEAMVRRSRERGLSALMADLRALPFASGSFDGAWSAAALLHVPREDTASTLAEWRRVLRPAATLALITTVGDREGWEVMPGQTASPDDPTRRWFVHRDLDSLAALLRGAGFDVSVAREVVGVRRWGQFIARAT